MASVNLTTHVSGLASGMDTETIVNNMMKVNRIPLDKLLQAKTINSWKTDAYREINTKIASFRDAMQDLRLEGTFTSAQKVTSNDSRIDVSMSGKATLSGFSITEAKLATAAKAAVVSFSSSKIKSGSDSIFDEGVEPADISFKINDKEIKISKDNSTLDKAIAEINSQIAKINSELGTDEKKLNIKASNIGGSMVFTTTDAGSGNSITISEYSGPSSIIKNGTTNDTMKSADIPLFTNSTDGSDGEKGYVVINGTKIDTTSNTFTFDNVQITLKQNITSGSGQASVSIVPDTDKIFDKIKTFVDQYNTLIKDLNDKISEKKYRDYPPLTDEQKKDMKDSDIKLWEDKAKSGLLAKDSSISQFLTQMRTSITEMVNGAGISLKDIGITTSTDYKENGKLVLDEDKLKSMLSTNLTDIQKLFAGKYDTGNYKDNTLNNPNKYKNSGIAVRVYDRIGDVLSSLKVIAGASTDSSLAKEAAEYDKRIATLQDRLSTTEQNLWAKFNAMEQALQKLNSQSSWLYQQLGQ